MSFLDNILNSSAFSYLQTTILASSSIAAALSGLLYFKQNELIYPRNIPEDARTIVPTPDNFDFKNWREVTLITPDGETLKNYLLRSTSSEPKGITVLMFHGNAGNIGHRVPIAKVFSEHMGSNVFMLGYRGYGFSSGTPSEKGLNIDAQTALDWILQDEETKNTKVVVYGQSLGGALAIQLAARNQDKLSGLMLENTFLSMRTLIPKAFPPAKYLVRLCHQVWPSEELIPSITTIPTLFLSGLKDELIPPSHMRRLYDLSNSPSKVWKEFPTGTHNDTCMAKKYFTDINSFLEEEVGKKVQ